MPKVETGLLLSVYPDGSIHEVVVTPKDKSKFSLAELQSFVGGYIELIPTKAGVKGILYANEERLLKHLPYNRKADLMKKPETMGHVHGNAILVRKVVA